MFFRYLTSLLLSFATLVLVHGQLQTGFISIDCGSPMNFNFVDIDTGISYTPDGAYINTGINKNISLEYAYPNNPNLAYPLSDLRSFPIGKRNCYTLTPADAKGNSFLLRASFLYGNYDDEDKLPEFDLYLDVTLWSSIKFINASHVVTTEIIGVALSDTISVCLVNKGLGIPFISALELRPLDNSIYGTELGNVSLVLFERFDVGYVNGTGRYRDDIYDRIWSPYNSPSWNVVSTSSEINGNENGYRAPLEVIRTAVMPRNVSDRLELSWMVDDDASRFYVYMYFAEVDQLEKNQTRKFNISWNGSLMFGPLVPRYMYATTISNLEAFKGKHHRISIYKTDDSNLPPILNAIEIYIAKQLDELPTFSDDVASVLNIKTTYQVTKGWIGDPCGPKNYTWEGLECNYSVSLPPRIVSLNLSSSGLSGMISSSFGNLSSVESLDLSNNHLTGFVPEFLKELKSLKLLNLEGNQLSGSVPKELVDRSKAGLLTLRVDEHNLCSSGSCKNKNILIPIVASVSSALLLSVALITLWRLRKKRNSESDNFNGEGRPLPSKNRQFTYDEVLNITNNFQDVIGKGGFGTVYRGNMKDGTRVAVKMLSTSSKQGSQEFQAEAELLMRVHHRNLASFVGYCDDGSNMALIYEYMANGNLKDYLSYKSSNPLSWEMRLRIAIDAAQGLEYLHHGCKPPIIHRDVKTANILLSENMDAKIADFGLSKAIIPSEGHTDVIVTKVMGTPGYLDPEYYRSRKLNEKSDVFSFGIVLLELITGQNAVIKKDESIHIVHWVSPMIESGDIESIVDRRLNGEFDPNSVSKALVVAMACTKPSSLHRATMSIVLNELNQCLAMELSHNRETKERVNEEIYIGSYSSSEIYSNSTATDSISIPR